MLSVVGKIYAGILVGRFRRVNGGLIDNEQGGFQSREGMSRSDLHPKADR